MALLYELEGIYAQLQAMELDDETFKDTLESIDFEKDLELNIEYFVKSKQVDILDETKIPLEFMKLEYKPIKTELSKHLKAGEVIEGVTLIEKESLQVK